MTKGLQTGKQPFRLEPRIDLLELVLRAVSRLVSTPFDPNGATAVHTSVNAARVAACATLSKLRVKEALEIFFIDLGFAGRDIAQLPGFHPRFQLVH